jgi:aminoglycoside phosphotransferase (APT) family kinase protein
VPEPVHVGRPSRAFPWPFYGARWIEGVEATFTEEREPLAGPLGRTLRALHDASVPDLPVDVNGRADMSRRVPLTRAELAAAAAEGLWEAPPSVAALLAQAEALPPPERLVVCHGDLHVRQVIVDGARLAGFVDWIDVCRSDPGIDLQLVFAFLPPAARPAFFAAYGPVDEASLLRARVLALFLSAVLARYARDVGNAALEREAVSSLDRAAHP